MNKQKIHLTISLSWTMVFIHIDDQIMKNSFNENNLATINKNKIITKILLLRCFKQVQWRLCNVSIQSWLISLTGSFPVLVKKFCFHSFAVRILESLQDAQWLHNSKWSPTDLILDLTTCDRPGCSLILTFEYLTHSA